jgi:hypothetical protein
MGYLMPKVGGGRVGWSADHVYGRSGRVWWVTTSNQWWSPLTPPINASHTPFSEMEIRKWGLAFYSAPKFILCRVEREVRSEGRRTSRHVRSPPTSSSVEAVQESVRVRQSFPSSSSVECGSFVRILWILTENWLSNPSGVLESRLVGIILWHYLRVGDSPIIVRHSFAALMLFVHLQTI